MSSQLSSLENATKYLTPADKDQFFRIKREMEKAGASKKSIEERLHAFMWEVVESDDEDEDEGDA
ncbi:hypothetical protein HB779_14055 [Phyllobacterium sp. 628]|uniref:hypothetical protein n=1 Tax=Phyllobacterium sp. 628 TaxID=2718938 RepID=UPI0016628B1A|nr:hypothetical protein [Phyllobacterium sp. 628]QND52903.1 hypothetical protein HB779_14055 [Phyllobacterium sp. 628]